jgi:hypothetical protein
LAAACFSAFVIFWAKDGATIIIAIRIKTIFFMFIDLGTGAAIKPPPPSSNNNRT